MQLRIQFAFLFKTEKNWPVKESKLAFVASVCERNYKENKEKKQSTLNKNISRFKRLSRF